MLLGSRVLGGAIALVFVGCSAVPASAQGNPFVPSSGASKAEVEKIVDSKLGEMERRLTAQIKGGKPGEPQAYGAPAGAAGPLNPTGAMNYPGAVPGALPGQGAMVAEVKLNPVEEARTKGVRFLGCINGTPKFVRTSGERVSFTKDQISQAIKDGVLPTCR